MEENNNFFDDNHNPVENQTVPMSDVKILSRCGLYLSLMSLVVFASQYILMFILNKLDPKAQEADWYGVLLTLVGVVFVGLPVFYGLMKKIPDSETGEKKNVPVGKFLGYFIICVGCTYAANYIGSFISAFLAFMMGVNFTNPLENFVYASDMTLLLIYGVIIAPIAEELIFRKILLDKLRRFGDLPAILLSGVAFGIFHFNLSQFFYAAVLGILFAYITIRTNRIIYSILLHMMINFMGLGFVPLLASDNNVLGAVFVLIWIFGSMTAGSLLVIFNTKNILLYRPIKPLVRRKDYVINPGSIIFIVLGVGIMLLSLVGAGM